MRLLQTYFFFTLPDSAIAHSINQYKIGPFHTAIAHSITIDVSMVWKGFGNEPLKDITMERMRIKEFEESLCEDCE